MEKVVIKVKGGQVVSVCTSEEMEVVVLDGDLNGDTSRSNELVDDIDTESTSHWNCDMALNYVDAPYSEYVVNYLMNQEF